MITLANGSLSLYDPNDPLDFGNLYLLNYQLTASSPATTVGTNLMSHSGLNTGSLNNMGWLVPENGSELQIGNLTGTGDITAIDATVVISGSTSSSETIGLVDNSQLWLGSPSVSATIDMDSTSQIHFYNPSTVASIVGNLTANSSETGGPFHGLFSNIHSLTPGYAPTPEFQFASPNSTAVIGVTIVDKPIPAPVPAPTPTPTPTPASTTSAIDTIVGSTVVNPTGSISATKGSNVEFNTSSAPTSDTISLDSTSTLAFEAPLGMSFLATIDMVAGSKVYLPAGIQGSSGRNDVTSSITEYPQLNLMDLYSGSTLEAQLHIHNESPGTAIWAAIGLKGLVTLTDSVSQPANQAGAGYPPDVAVPIHVIG